MSGAESIYQLGGILEQQRAGLGDRVMREGKGRTYKNIRKIFRIIRRKLQNVPTVSLRPASSLENQRMKHRFMITIPIRRVLFILDR